jgi:formylglycine-generating enzyme required for sulfatase activity
VLPDQGSITWDLRDPGPPGYVPIPPGPFIDGPRGPLRSTEVLIYADRHEVTQDAWREFLAATDGKRPPGGEGQRVEGVDGAPDGGDAAVTGVNFDDAVSFAAWMTATRGQGRFLFRLPTALEWKKMSRGTDGRLHPWGNDSREDPFRKAHSGSTESVRTHPEWCSPYGLHHMESNAAEWTADAADPAGVRRVVMGRSFSPEADQVRILAGIGDPASRRAPDLGFRLVAEPVLP